MMRKFSIDLIFSPSSCSSTIKKSISFFVLRLYFPLHLTLHLPSCSSISLSAKMWISFANFHLYEHANDNVDVWRTVPNYTHLLSSEFAHEFNIGVKIESVVTLRIFWENVSIWIPLNFCLGLLGNVAKNTWNAAEIMKCNCNTDTWLLWWYGERIRCLDYESRQRLQYTCDCVNAATSWQPEEVGINRAAFWTLGRVDINGRERKNTRESPSSVDSSCSASRCLT